MKTSSTLIVALIGFLVTKRASVSEVPTTSQEPTAAVIDQVTINGIESSNDDISLVEVILILFFFLVFTGLMIIVVSLVLTIMKIFLHRRIRVAPPRPREPETTVDAGQWIAQPQLHAMP